MVWETAPWKLSSTVDIRGSIVGESDPLLAAEQSALTWTLVDRALDHLSQKVSDRYRR